MVTRLTRLPPKEKAKILVGQLLPTLHCGAELHHTPWEEGERLVREMSRWAVGASSGERVEALTGIDQLQRQMLVKRVRWAASVYGRHIPILRKSVEGILKKHLDQDGLTWRWMKGGKERIGGVTVVEGHERGEFSDGSSRYGHTAAATTTRGFYLGQVATVLDAEMLGVAMGWAQSKQVAPDSQAAIGRILELRFDHPRSWIEEIVVAVQNGKEKEIAWVKAHDGVPGNEYADYKAGGWLPRSTGR